MNEVQEKRLAAKRGRKNFHRAKEMLSRFSLYLKSHNIFFESDITEEGTPRITMLFKNCEKCPDRITEGCIYFFDDCMEARVYYSELGAEICGKSERLLELYRLMNFFQARLWTSVTDGVDGALYKSHFLFCPRFYVTEDEMFDITATCIIPYAHYEMDELQTEDFITVALPDLLNSLAVPIFLLLTNKITTDEAIELVKKIF